MLNIKNKQRSMNLHYVNVYVLMKSLYSRLEEKLFFHNCQKFSIKSYFVAIY